MAAPTLPVRPAKKNGKGAPPAAPDNNQAKPAAAELVPLNFKTDAEFARDFRVYAAMHNMKLVELLKASFENYKASQG